MLYDRATVADPLDSGAPRAAAELLAEAGKSEEAEQRLEDHLREHAYDSKAAMQLARLQLARGAESDGILALARRAVRFGGALEARRLLAQVHRERGEAELAAKVLAEAGTRDAEEP